MLRATIKTAINDLESIILEFDNNQEPFTLSDIEAKYKPERFNNFASTTLNSFVDALINDLENENRIGNAKAYSNLKTIFVKLIGDNFLMQNITEDVVRDFINKMTLQGLSVNSRAVHLRELRALINKAIKSGFNDEANYPFKNISIKSQKTRKRAVNKDIITI